MAVAQFGIPDDAPMRAICHPHSTLADTNGIFSPEREFEWSGHGMTDVY